MKPSDIFNLYKKVFRISGLKVSLLIFSSLPIGLALGALEILFGLSLLYLLSSFNLIAASNLPGWFVILTFLGPIATFVILGVVKVLFFFLSNLASNIGYEGFNVVIRKRMSELIFSNNTADLPISIADFSSFFSNLLPKSAVFISSTIQAVSGFITLLVTLIGLLLLSARLTLTAFIAFLILGIPLFFTRKLFQKYSALVYAKSDEFSKRILRDLRNIYFLKIIGRTNAESANLNKINRDIMSNYFGYIFGISANSSLPLLVVVFIIATLVMVNQKFNLVEVAFFIPFVYLLVQSAVNLGKVITAVGNCQFNKLFFQDLVSLLEKIETGPDFKVQDQGINSELDKITTLKVENLSVGRKNPIISGLSFSAQCGDFVCIAGESGKGKTTLLMTLIGLIPHKNGKIFWNGISVDNINPIALKSRVAFSGPDPFLLDSTVRENVLLGNERYNYFDDAIWKALTLSGCDFVNKLPGKLDCRLQEAGEGISAGEKQRLSIARSLLRRPEILILDEATANIDMKTEEFIFKNIRQYLPQCLILAVSHRESVANFSTVKIAL